MNFLKPRIMDNGTEYYLAHEVKFCIEQAAKQIEETHSAYKELNQAIVELKEKNDRLKKVNELYRELLRVAMFYSRDLTRIKNSKLFKDVMGDKLKE